MYEISVPGDVFKHEDDAHHVEDEEKYLHNHPVQSLPLDLVVMLLLELQLAVKLRDGVEDLGEVGALEDAEHDGDERIAHDRAEIRVNRHLKENDE